MGVPGRFGAIRGMGAGAGACVVAVVALVGCGGPAGAAAEGPDGAAPDATTSSDAAAADTASGTTGDATVDDSTGKDLDSGSHGIDSSSRREAGVTDGESPVDAPPSTDAAVACGTRTGMRGLTNRSVVAAGLNRTYWVYLPSGFSATTPMPFVYLFHGYTESGQDMVNMTNYQAIADAEGVALAFPDGQGGPNSILPPWNVEDPGQLVCGLGQLGNATGNDFAFMDAMKADISNDQCLDAAHTFVTGFSMGGYFTEHVGCERPDIRAVAPHSGGTLASLSSCTTGHVPILLFHGTADNVIADGCDDPNATPQVGFPPAATLWAQKNGCQTTYTTVPTDGDGGGDGQCYVYDGCPADGQVELCTFTNMQHCWAGGVPNEGDTCPTYASATQLEWAFFKKYAW